MKGKIWHYFFIPKQENPSSPIHAEMQEDSMFFNYTFFQRTNENLDFFDWSSS
jgi:hypothetical protein